MALVNRTGRRIAIGAGVLVIVWIVLLLVLGGVVGERKARAIADRLGETLQTTGTIGDHDLALIRGRLEIEKLAFDRDDPIGKLSLSVGGIRCELLPFGGALLDGNCRELAIEDLKLELSTFALFKLKKPTRPPIRAAHVVIENATLVFSPAAVVPSLGRIALTIERATAGPTVLKTPLSWLFALQTLQATLELPFGTIKIDYANGKLRAGGAMFGKTPVTLPFKMPAAHPTDDPKAELARLVKAGRSLAEQLVEQKARDWLRVR
ncbi:MAG: hypothetical protein QM756_26280 [Polyangiaceae bacterium]